jgi:hypothetical protein
LQSRKEDVKGRRRDIGEERKRRERRRRGRGRREKG